MTEKAEGESKVVYQSMFKGKLRTAVEVRKEEGDVRRAAQKEELSFEAAWEATEATGGKVNA